MRNGGLWLGVGVCLVATACFEGGGGGDSDRVSPHEATLAAHIQDLPPPAELPQAAGAEGAGGVDATGGAGGGRGATGAGGLSGAGGRTGMGGAGPSGGVGGAGGRTGMGGAGPSGGVGGAGPSGGVGGAGGRTGMGGAGPSGGVGGAGGRTGMGGAGPGGGVAGAGTGAPGSEPMPGGPRGVQVRPWIACGTLRDMVACQMPDHPPARYEYGIAYNSLEPMEVACTTWNIGLRVYNRFPYMIFADNPAVSMQWGGFVFYKDTNASDDDDCQGSWRHRYWTLGEANEIRTASSNGCYGQNQTVFCRQR